MRLHSPSAHCNATSVLADTPIRLKRIMRAGLKSHPSQAGGRMPGRSQHEVTKLLQAWRSGEHRVRAASILCHSPSLSCGARAEAVA
jgi:hypothetical protein